MRSNFSSEERIPIPLPPPLPPLILEVTREELKRVRSEVLDTIFELLVAIDLFRKDFEKVRAHYETLVKIAELIHRTGSTAFAIVRIPQLVLEAIDVFIDRILGIEKKT